MAIQQVRAQINGQWYTLTLQANGKYEASITAPGATSFNQPGGYYDVTVEATNTAGTTGTANAGTLDGLKLYVKETVAPVITILSPSFLILLLTPFSILQGLQYLCFLLFQSIV